MPTAVPETVRVRRAGLPDAPDIQRLITHFALRDEMLHRSLGEVYENLRDFYVSLDDAGRVVGCGALHICWSHLAEVKSLAVDEAVQGRGHGRRIVEACLDEARALGLRQVFALTYRPGFFERCGFRVVDKSALPHKVWNECIRCPKFVGCTEIAVLCELGGPRVELPVVP